MASERYLGGMKLPFNHRKPTVSRCRAFWERFVLMWSRLGEVHVALETAPSEEIRWWRVWHFDDRGRGVSYPWFKRR